MIADHFTKRLQGTIFRKFRNEIMNITRDADIIGMGMHGKGLAEGVTRKLHNKKNTACP